mmetsp:Transcript_20899/g.23295  ORF Transcript_20899/g.23295 Transcript_20899/m.23295 type:complete len:178 (-) Transcript_20899:138-671(-)
MRVTRKERKGVPAFDEPENYADLPEIFDEDDVPDNNVTSNKSEHFVFEQDSSSLPMFDPNDDHEQEYQVMPSGDEIRSGNDEYMVPPPRQSDNGNFHDDEYGFVPMSRQLPANEAEIGEYLNISNDSPSKPRQYVNHSSEYCSLVSPRSPRPTGRQNGFADNNNSFAINDDEYGYIP